MKIVKLIILFCILFFSFENLFLGQASEISSLKKDPFLAGALSFYNPGLGQIYAGETGKGLLFWAAENTLFFSALLTVMDVSLKLKKDFGFEFRIKQKDNLSNERIYASIGLGLAFIVLHIYNIFDAVEDVRNYNKKLEEEYLGWNGVQLGINGSKSGLEVYFAHSF